MAEQIEGISKGFSKSLEMAELIETEQVQMPTTAVTAADQQSPTPHHIEQNSNAAFEQIDKMTPEQITNIQIDNIPLPNDESFWRRFWQNFWEKIKSIGKNCILVAKKIARELIEKALTLYHILLDNDTPQAARGLILGGLFYFVSPVDAIPDFLPHGYTDDLAVLTAVIGAVAGSIKPEHRARAKARVDEIFGSETTGRM